MITESRMNGSSGSASASCKVASACSKCCSASAKRASMASGLPVQRKRQRRVVHAMLLELLVAQVLGRREHQVALGRLAPRRVMLAAPGLQALGQAQRQRGGRALQEAERRLV